MTGFNTQLSAECISLLWNSYFEISVLYFNILLIVIYSCYKAEFSALLLQFLVSRDHSEIILICWFAAEETFFIMNAENYST